MNHENFFIQKFSRHKFKCTFDKSSAHKKMFEKENAEKSNGELSVRV